MVHTNVVSAAVATTTVANPSAERARHDRPARPPVRLLSSGSFHAGAPFPSIPGIRRNQGMRRQSTYRYHTFPTPPPKTSSEMDPEDEQEYENGDDGSDGGDGGDDIVSPEEMTPLPWKQLGLLAILSLAEQTALNSIGPYLPAMVASFDGIPETQTGMYVGLLASAFAMAQLTTNLLWGYLSDTIGRKPVMLLGTSLLMVCFVLFGFCSTYNQVLAVHVAMGLLNGNAAVVPTCLGEVTDRSNQSRAFTWLPVMYSIGGITGPALGGLLVGGDDSVYPFLAPNVMSAALLLSSVVVLGIWFDETLDGADGKATGAGLGWLVRVFQCGCLDRQKARTGSWSSRWPTRAQGVAGVRSGEDGLSDDSDDGDESQGLLQPQPDEASNEASDDAKLSPKQKSAFRQLANRTTLTVLITYLVFQLSNISFNSLYPIFASAPPPTGRDLGPDIIGLSLSFAGFATILFQITVFQPLKARMGNLGTYRWALLGIAVSMALMPWIGYTDDAPLWGAGSGTTWLYGELGFILVVKNICAVGGLSSVMLLITNSAPSNETLGTLNGIAQTLSAAGRSIGPFVSGSLFTLSTRVRPKGEALAWGLFAGIAVVGWFGTLLIRGHGLESGDWVGDHDDDEESDSLSDEEAAGNAA